MRPVRRRFLPPGGALFYSPRLMSETGQRNDSDFNVGYLAHLARLELAPAEQEKLQQQLEHILHYVEELNQVNIDGVPPMATSITAETCLRSDTVQPVLDHEVVMANAPAQRHGQFLVPRILE